MKIGFVLFSALLFSISSWSQMWNGQDTLYGNEWIVDQENPIYKFTVGEDGVYRVSYETLRASGFPVDNVSAKNFRLFKNGEEVAVYISREGILSGGDFIEFYGFQNRDDLDKFLVPDPENQWMNSNTSLYEDNSAYFLTWSDTESNVRIINIENDFENLPEPEPFFLAELIRNYSTTLVKNQGLQAGVFWSNYEESEGLCGGFKTNFTEDLSPSRLFTEFPVDGSVEFRMGFDFRSAQAHTFSLNDSILLDTSFFGSNVRTFKFDIPSDKISVDMDFNFRQNEGSDGRFALSHLILKYPRRFDFANRSSYNFELEGSTERRYFEVARFRENVDGNNLVIDYVNNVRLTPLHESNRTKFTLPPMAKGQLIMIDEEEEIIQIEQLDMIAKIDFEALDNEYIILSNDELYVDTLNENKNWVAEYANYRASQAGGQFGVTILNVKDLYLSLIHI